MRSVTLLLLLFSAQASAVVTCVSANNFLSGLTTIPLTVVSGAGDGIVVFTSARNATARTFTVSDTVNTYVNGPAIVPTFLQAAGWTAANVAAATYTVTVTVSSAAAFNAAACNVSSVTAALLVGSGSKSTCVSGSGTTCTSNAFSVSGAAGNIVLAYGASYDGTTWTAGTSGSDSMTLVASTLQNDSISSASQVESVTLSGAATTASITTVTGLGDPVYIIAFVLDAVAASTAGGRVGIL